MAEIDRKKLLKKIQKASEWAPAFDLRNYNQIIKNIETLQKELNLFELQPELQEIHGKMLANEKYHVEVSASFTSRQRTCTFKIKENVEARNLQGTYHELYDFIHAYGELYEQPISIYEKTIIRSAIVDLDRILEETYDK